jgi:ActR/RegA family two-component response regulator
MRPHDPRAAAGARFSLAVLLAGVDEQRLILVVEDDEATRTFLADNFAADGFRVATAAGAGEGLRALEVRMPSLVVLDLTLEGAGSRCSIACARPTGSPPESIPTCR